MVLALLRSLHPLTALGTIALINAPTGSRHVRITRLYVYRVCYCVRWLAEYWEMVFYVPR